MGQAFGIKVGEQDMLSRCVACNGEFSEQALSWGDLPPDAQLSVPTPVRGHHDEYWLCSRCNKVAHRPLSPMAC